MGATVAPDKNCNFASNSLAKEWLTNTYWKTIKSNITVAENSRYLGAHISVGGRSDALTLRKRFKAGIAMITRIAKLPVTRGHKAMMIRIKVLAAALYGSEVAQATERDVADLADATAKAIANKTSHHDLDWLFTTCSRGADLDVVTNLLARKCTMIKRAVAKRPHELKNFQEVIRLHVGLGTKGATLSSDKEAQSDGSLASLQPAPHPTRASRAMWKPNEIPNDPIAHLLNDIHHIGAKLNTNLQILMHNEAPIDIIGMPYEYLYKTVLQAGASARTRAAEGTKQKNAELYEIDIAATIASHKSMPEEDLMYLQTLQAGGGWTETQLHGIGAIDHIECDLCGQVHKGFDKIWECTHPELEKTRKETDAELAQLDQKCLPETIKRGIAPAMGHGANETFWATAINESVMSTKQAELIGMTAPLIEHPDAMEIQKVAKRGVVSARQLIATLRGGHGDGSFLKYPEDIQGLPTDKPIGFTGGSVKNPESSDWQMAGFGMYWPEPLTDEEKAQIQMYTFHQKEKDGTSMWGRMTGQHAHSTRTELAALLIARLRPIPLHIATDSQALIDKAEK